ncbi:hydrogenase 3 maturation endopeptidase HyCI [Methanoregula formicica]|uniref:Hydrogenase maturation protease n=1 Tax=Methanoregula formicica (strain DSM 22288 / NBRC 105244 / SMSP) TaxID=593750 RepID=L0HB53_METFS|nr:hydrogenase 3 maturation endopeptidase HyCI [Methanoregula formicica]AGB01225.1 hydrogenase maturation protease [Methanoregula formicica SMSP]
MTTRDPAFPDLRRRLGGTRLIAVVGIGDELSHSDRLGMTAAREIDRQSIPGVQVFLAGTVPENITGPLRRYRPDHILLLDAAEMGERPGTIARIEPGRVRAGLFSTHALPLPVVMEYIERDIGIPVTLLGIQPGSSGAGDSLTGKDRAYLKENLRQLSEALRDR